MALHFSTGEEPEVMVDINTTPLIDVMLVLLIMLIITIPMQTHAVKLDLPQATTPPAAMQPQVDEVDIDFDGTILWNGIVLPTRAGAGGAADGAGGAARPAGAAYAPRQACGLQICRRGARHGAAPGRAENRDHRL